MIESIRKMWKIEELRKKILYTFMMLVLFRLVGVIPAPGVDIAKVMSQNNTSSLPLLELVNMMTGNAFSQMTLMAMGITPYINASIIMQLLTIAIPALERMSKEDDGRHRPGSRPRIYPCRLAELCAGRREHGGRYRPGHVDRRADHREGRRQRRVPPDLRRYHFEPVQRDRVRLQHRHDHRHEIAKQVKGRRVYGGQNTHMSLKVVSVGVLPLIFAYSFLAFPGTIAQLIDPKTEGWFTQWWTRNMYTGSVWYMIISALLIIAFTFFYSSISFDPKQQAEQLQQQGAVIPGQRGRNIRQYLQNIMNRLNLFAALFLAILAAVPTLLLRLAGVQVPFAASSILIAVSVSLETVRTIQGEMSVRGIDMDMDNVGFM